jgi:hypothetical protein
MEVITTEMKKIALALLIAGILALQGCSGGGRPPENKDINTETGTRTGSAQESAGSMKITIPEHEPDETTGKAKLSLQAGKQTEREKTLTSGGLFSDRTTSGEKTGGKPAANENSETAQAKDQQKNQTPAGEEQTESSAGDSGKKTKKKKKPAGDVEIRLGFAGDLNLSEGWETTEFMDEQKNGISDCFSADILKMMRGFDLFMLNNEFTYSLRGDPQAKSYTFRADPDRVKNLDTLGVDLVLVANNHIKDYGEESLLDTLDTLDQAKIERVGAGRNIKEAAAPVLYKVNGHKIAYVAASCAEEHEDTIWTSPATEDSPGIMACYDPEPFYQAVRNAAQNPQISHGDQRQPMLFDAPPLGDPPQRYSKPDIQHQTGDPDPPTCDDIPNRLDGVYHGCGIHTQEIHKYRSSLPIICPSITSFGTFCQFFPHKLYTTMTRNHRFAPENIAIVHKSAQTMRLRIDYSKICAIVIMNIYVLTQRSFTKI